MNNSSLNNSSNFHATTYETEAKNVIESLKKACTLYAEGKKNAAFDSLSEFNSAPLSHDVLESISEYLGEDRNAPTYNAETGQWDHNVPLSEPPCDRNLLSRCLNIFRGHSDSESYGVYNIISIMKKGRDNDLSGEDLSELDLRNCSLNGVRFSHNGCHANFNNAFLDHYTFFPQGPEGWVCNAAFRIKRNSTYRIVGITLA